MENKKIIVNTVLILSGILFILLVTLFIITTSFRPSDKTKETSPSNPTPTSYPLRYNDRNQRVFSSASISPTPSLPLITATDFTGVKEVEVDPQIAAETNQSFQLKQQLPLKKGNLKIDFDYQKEVFVISPINNQVSISEQEKEDILSWLKQNYPNLNQQNIIFSSTPFISPTPKKPNINITPVIITPSAFPEEQNNAMSALVDLLKVIYNQPIDESGLSSTNSSSFSQTNPTNPSSSNQTGAGSFKISYTPPKNQYNYVYYPQCHGPFDDYPLPGGCDICYAGCGPTTVAMIIASYKDKSVDPITIVDQYGTRVGCPGSSYLDAINTLRSYGINVGSLIFATAYNEGKKASQVAPIFKNYLNAGKTLFVLANFKSDGGGHYFWIIDIDENNNLWAFDPYYGRYQIPYNENSRFPFPLYRLAFPVSP